MEDLTFMSNDQRFLIFIFEAKREYEKRSTGVEYIRHCQLIETAAPM